MFRYHINHLNQTALQKNNFIHDEEDKIKKNTQKTSAITIRRTYNYYKTIMLCIICILNVIDTQ